MKKLISSLTLVAVITFGFANASYADPVTDTTAAAVTADSIEKAQSQAAAQAAAVSDAANNDNSKNATPEPEKEADLSFVQKLKQSFIQGDPFWMTPVLICLIIGLALSIERIVYLNLSTINTKRFLDEVETALKNGGVDAAKDVCRNTRGPIASIFYQGLDRSEEGIDMVEKSVVAYGGVQMGLLEKGLSWLSLFIALAPMLGFMGTVIGMIQAFEQIVKDGQVSPITVAGGIQVALLTTVFGLISAIFLQIFYNYIVSKVDGIVNEMEDASISLIDMMLKLKVAKA
ncbi:MAG: MotA/TolQ/ExbB proton channel family protein [Crocinitomicaceae bacterium]|nr:MotA/TolQ/ExbB proton channel family protein [Crocinitomicaceae bacterium]MDC0100237.1 MotA/TolQ/ExbB proton channel family protein [Crocinitomicaceae bacterium]MDC1385329.1 MotA/TolQ/ExbB proton channel family protein [Crocinitomicaceae bacterium]|tara:strand:+ start:25167 stop:26030 length:864 start_codon:yes stop_codon:yes gene_type:complete